MIDPLKKISELFIEFQRDWDRYIVSKAKEDPTLLVELPSLKNKEVQNVKTTGKSQKLRV